MIDISVIDITFRDVRSRMSMDMLRVTLDATVKQPALINFVSAYISRMDMYACVCESIFKISFYCILNYTLICYYLIITGIVFTILYFLFNSGPLRRRKYFIRFIVNEKCTMYLRISYTYELKSQQAILKLLNIIVTTKYITFYNATMSI